MLPTVEYYEDTFDLKEILKEKNTKKCGVIHFARKANCNWIDIPVLIAVGKEDGKVLLADACHHGDEQEGTEGIIAAFNELNTEEMKGAFIGIPVLNVEAFAEGRRYGTQDYVPLDMNRSYSQMTTGTLTKHITSFYMEKCIKKSSAVITIHGGGNGLYLEPITDYQHMGDDEISRTSLEMAKAFGINYLWQIPASEYDPRNGIMDENAYAAGVPVILPEIGGQVTRLEQREGNVDIVRKGIINVLRCLNIIDEPVIEYGDHLHLQIEFLYTRHGGIHKPLKKGGERARKGETLAIVTDLYGNETDRTVAPYDCIIEGYWAYPVAYPRGWSYVIGREVEA